MSQLDTHLKDLMDAAVAPLRGVTSQRMFGSQAWFVDGKIFAIAWDGLPAVKLVGAEKYNALLALPGAQTWSPMGPKAKAMSAWVVMPESSIDDEDELREWLREAHRGIAALPPKVKKGTAVKKPLTAKKKRAPAVKKRAVAGKKRRP